MMKRSEDEDRVLAHIKAAHREILDWGLDCNTQELTQAVHTMQMFVIMHMLGRDPSGEWSDWYGQQEWI